MRRRRLTVEHLDDPSADVPESLDLREIDEGVAAMFAHIPRCLAATSRAFLSGDREAARRLVETDSSIDSLQLDIERLVQAALAHQPVQDGELRFLVTILRIVPELERSADLVEHIALRTQPALTHALSPRALKMIGLMSDIAVNMWRDAEAAYGQRDARLAPPLRSQDDELDDLHVQLTDELSRAQLETSAAIELGLVARFLERLGDHAVNVVGRLAYVHQPGSSAA